MCKYIQVKRLTNKIMNTVNNNYYITSMIENPNNTTFEYFTKIIKEILGLPFFFKLIKFSELLNIKSVFSLFKQITKHYSLVGTYIFLDKSKVNTTTNPKYIKEDKHSKKKLNHNNVTDHLIL